MALNPEKLAMPMPNPPAKPAPARFLLLRGLMREQRHWGEFIPILQARFPGSDIVTLDIPGNGEGHRADSPTSVADMTESLRRQLAEKGRSGGPFTLIAISMGGMLAIDWMVRHPAEIASATLINTSLKNFAPFHRRLRWQNYLKIIAILGQAPAQREAGILALTANRCAQDAALLRQWQAWQAQCPVSGRNALRQLWAAARFTAPQKPSQPLLLLSSRADRLVSFQCSVSIQRAWGCELQLHEEAGHDLALDDPHWVCDAIERAGAAGRR